jgi:hypothetical protein
LFVTYEPHKAPRVLKVLLLGFTLKGMENFLTLVIITNYD